MEVGIKKGFEIKDFEFYNSDVLIGSSTCGNEITFPDNSEDISSKKIITFSSADCNRKISIGLSNDTFNSVFFRFEETPFSKDELNQLAATFEFDLEPHEYHNKYLMGSFSRINPEYKNKCFGAIQKCDNNYFLMIYSSRNSNKVSGMAKDFFGDNVFYIHVICSVKISSELFQLLK
jgi:hypothetical protein